MLTGARRTTLVACLAAVPVPVKLCGLVAITAVAMAPIGWGWACGLLAAVGTLMLLVAPLRAVRRPLLAALITATLVGIYQLWTMDVSAAVNRSAGLLATIVFALIVTVTTPVSAFLDAIERLLFPLRRVLRPSSVALAVTIMLRSIPQIVHVVADTRMAARGRGLDSSARAHLVPVVIRTVAYGQNVGEALAARGLPDDDASDETMPY